MSDISVRSNGVNAQLACIWEVTARKPGNVHRFRDFGDSSYADFLLSAAAIAPILDEAENQSIGETVLNGIRATRRLVRTNTNLGILLLLAPLAAVPRSVSLRDGIREVIDGSTVADAVAVYQAIRMASPAGLGKVPEQDIGDEPTQNLAAVMALAADRDLIARQYANGFCEVLGDGSNALEIGMRSIGRLEDAIIYCHLSLMSQHPDSLIARKRGWAEAEEASRRARSVLSSGWPESRAGAEDLDRYLRAEGNSRNPGTIADLVTACLFVALREGSITVPNTIPWSDGGEHA